MTDAKPHVLLVGHPPVTEFRMIVSVPATVRRVQVGFNLSVTDQLA